MEWITCLRETIAYLENHLTEEIDLDKLSRCVCLSPFYLQKGFRMVTGYAIGEYVRSRRLYEAALALMAGDTKIIDLALTYGYDAPESFSKAFTRFHGCTPSELRRGNGKITPFLPLQISLSVTGGKNMNFTVSPMWGMKLIGFERTFTYQNGYAEIPKFWDEICEKYCNHTIYAGLAPSCPEEQAIIDNCIGEYGVCIDDLGNDQFRYLIAGRYTGGEVPESMTLIELPQGEWAKFKCVGAVPEALQKLNTSIFKEWLPGNPDYEMSGGYNIEWYSCDGDKTDPDYESGIWIPVKKKA